MQERAEAEGDTDGYARYRGRKMRELDREYADYRRDQQDRFDRDFAAWRDKRNRPPEVIDEPLRSEQKADELKKQGQ